MNSKDSKAKFQKITDPDPGGQIIMDPDWQLCFASFSHLDTQHLDLLEVALAVAADRLGLLQGQLLVVLSPNLHVQIAIFDQENKN